MRKSPGPDDIVTEMLVAASDMGIAELTKLSNMMYCNDVAVMNQCAHMECCNTQ